MISRNIVRSFLLFYLVFPFLFLIYSFRIDSWPNLEELFWAFKNSFIQAFFSALFSLLLGLWVAMGLLSFSDGFRRRYRRIFEIICLLPNFLPPLFTLLALLNVVDPFPMGTIGIVLAHTAINFGLVAVLITILVESKIGSLAELAEVEGCSRWQFLRYAFLPILRRDLLLLGLFVFAVCFSGFSIPLIVGGGTGTTIEVLIYEKIRLSSNWSEAVLLASFQSLFIFGITMVARKDVTTNANRIVNFRFLRMPSGIAILVILSFLGFYGYIQGVIDGFKQVSAFYEIQSALIWNFLGSVAVGLSTGILSFASLLAIAFCSPSGWRERIMLGYVAPSTSLCCFAFLMFGMNEEFWPFVKIPLALNVLFLGGLYRMGWDGILKSLASQIEIANSFGASSWLIFQEVVLPQVASRAALLSGIAAVWACGDYAASRILSHRDLTLAMTIETLMSSYRLGLATVLSLALVFCGALCFFFMTGVGRVFSRKSI